MKKWMPKYTFIAGLLLIALTNAIALGGVAYNRSGTTSVLKLTQRELSLPYYYDLGPNHENSGISLEIRWRVLQRESKSDYSTGLSYYWSGGTPDWLDQDKITSLGFNVDVEADDADQRTRYLKQLSKDVLLVLEYDGPAYQTALQRAKEFRERQSALQKANPGKQGFEQRLKNAQESLVQEQQLNSRLFVIDAGRDYHALRTQHPDATRYEIVRGQIQPSIATDNKKTVVTGNISRLSNHVLHVPLTYRGVFEAITHQRFTGVASDNPDDRYNVNLAFGMRLEPWITGATTEK